MWKKPCFILSIFLAFTVWPLSAQTETPEEPYTDLLISINERFLDIFDQPLRVLTEFSSDYGWYTDNGRYDVKQFDEWLLERLAQITDDFITSEPTEVFQQIENVPSTYIERTPKLLLTHASTLVSAVQAMAPALDVLAYSQNNDSIFDEYVFWKIRTLATLGLLSYSLFELELFYAIAANENAASWYKDLLLAGAYEATTSNFQIQSFVASRLRGDDYPDSKKMLKWATTANDDAKSRLTSLNRYLKKHAPSVFAEEKSNEVFSTKHWKPSNLERLNTLEGDIIGDIAFARRYLEEAVALNDRAISRLTDPSLDLFEHSPLWTDADGQSALNDEISNATHFTGLMSGVLSVIQYDL